MKKMLLAFILASTLAVSSGFPQSAAKISRILRMDEITNGDAAYFACVARKLADENTENSEAFRILNSGIMDGEKFFGDGETADQKISLSKACLLVARTTEMKGGIFYSLFKTPRYAFREFKALNVIPAEADPGQTVSGSEFIAILNGAEERGKSR